MDDRAIARAFNAHFALTHQTILQGGALEPAYLPDAGCRSLRGRSIIRYRHNYAASALHELAHWCLAGHARRACYDYGFRYDPPPRDAERQQAFFAAELSVQALERAFCEAASMEFEVSADDLCATRATVAQFAADVAAVDVEPLLTCEATIIVQLLRTRMVLDGVARL